MSPEKVNATIIMQKKTNKIKNDKKEEKETYCKK